jgi:hypothetical protein
MDTPKAAENSAGVIFFRFRDIFYFFPHDSFYTINHIIPLLFLPYIFSIFNPISRNRSVYATPPIGGLGSIRLNQSPHCGAYRSATRSERRPWPRAFSATREPKARRRALIRAGKTSLCRESGF